MFFGIRLAVYDQPLTALTGSQHLIDALGVVYLIAAFYKTFPPSILAVHTGQQIQRKEPSVLQMEQLQV